MEINTFNNCSKAYFNAAMYHLIVGRVVFVTKDLLLP